MKRSLAHIPELDGMRGIAALAIFVLHLFVSAMVGSGQPVPPAWGIPYKIAILGASGVDVFFVLSGFLITCLLIADRARPHFYRNFYWKRVLRIQPVYLMHLAASWWLLPGSHAYVISALLFVVNFDSFLRIPEVGPAWTLSIEEQFYLVWPQVVRRVSIRHLYGISLLVAGFSVGLRVGMALVFKHFNSHYTVYRFDGFALGGLLACQWMDEDQQAPVWVIQSLRLLNGRVLLYLAAALQLWYVLAPQENWLPISLFVINFLTYRAIRVVLANSGANWLQWLRSRPLTYLGAISYSLYMFHLIVLHEYDLYIAQPSFRFNPFCIRALLVFATTLVVCDLTRRFVELPALRLRRFVLK